MSEHEHDDEQEIGPDTESEAEDVGLEETEAAHRQAEERVFVAETSEGAQELAPRGTTTAGELRNEVGAVLRLPEGGYVDPGDIDIERRDDQTMIINMGPQHPSTHGVLRLMLELDGETVLRTKPIIGYLHTGMEKTGEELTYVQGCTNVTRMDYLSPLHNELVFSLATEALLDV
jgi:NADH-quinone oxidoreductase subunit D